MNRSTLKVTFPRGLLLLSLVVIALVTVGALPQQIVKAQDSDIQVSPGRDELIAKVNEQGSIRVIVGLDMDFQLPGDLSDAAEQKQEWGIAQAQTQLVMALASYDTELIAAYDYIPYIALEVDAAALDYLLASPYVKSIEEDVIFKAALASTTDVIDADIAWAQGYEGSGQIVAILDTGVEASHPFFGGRVLTAEEACYSTNDALIGAESLCPGGGTSQTGAGSASPNVPKCMDGATNLCNHGTHVAGIAAGNGTSYDGVARSSNIIAIQVFSRYSGDSTTCGGNNNGTIETGEQPCVATNTANVLSGLQRVYERRGAVSSIAAVNLSLQVSDAIYTSACDGTFNALLTKIQELRDAGIATVVSAGNGGATNGLSAPACLSNVISVGATNDSDVVAPSSNSASFLRLLAPGVSVTSSVPGGGELTLSDGTSLAAPHVTGAWAVLKSAQPTATVAQVLAALQTSGVSVTDSKNGITKPRIDVDGALGELGATGPLAVGYYEETDPRLDYEGTWNVYAESDPSGGSMKYTNAPGASVSFSITGGIGLKIYRSMTTNRGPMDVCIDGRCETVYNYSATTHWAMVWFKSGLGTGVHNIVINYKNNQYIDLDAIEVLP